jgi:hypothetical protein|tara:strand:- start:1390 stop:1566 length:177 start_codon:yes stop_codon:yes gene_type:complete
MPDNLTAAQRKQIESGRRQTLEQLVDERTHEFWVTIGEMKDQIKTLEEHAGRMKVLHE